MIKLLIGGSPCTFWSIAQKNNRETEATGMGWELFKNFLIARDKYKPDYFLYENNKSMSAAIREQITHEFGFEPVLINSALVSAQNRQRLYWVGKREPDGTYIRVDVSQPEDRGCFLRDILETNTEEKGYTLAEPVGVGYRNRREDDGKLYRRFETSGVPKSNALTTVQTDTMVAAPIRIGTIESGERSKKADSQANRVYSCDGKSVNLLGQGGGCGAKTGLYTVPAEDKTYPVYEVKNGFITIKGKEYPIKLADGYYIIRKLTVTECKRLQTVPDSYHFPVSNAQAYKMLGNGWTVEVITHIMSHFDGLTSQPIEVLSMYDGMSCGHIALDNIGAKVVRYYATEIDQYAIKTTLHNYPDTVQLGDAFQLREDGWGLPAVTVQYK